MSTDEEYLDNLLKTMSTDDTEENDDNKIMSLMNETDPMENGTAPMRKEVFSDIRPEDEIPSADKKDDVKKTVVDESWKAELDEMLAKADKGQETLESVPEEPVEKKKEKKKRHFLFGKKIKDKDSRKQDSAQTEPAETADIDQRDGTEEEKIQSASETNNGLTGEDNDNSTDWTSLLDSNSDDQEGQENGEPFEEPDWADEIPEKNEKKKKGFFGNLLETLFREEPDIDIEEETEGKPEKEKKEKKKKEKKGKSKEKAKATEAEGGEESEGKGTEDKKDPDRIADKAVQQQRKEMRKADRMAKKGERL